MLQNKYQLGPDCWGHYDSDYDDGSDCYEVALPSRGYTCTVFPLFPLYACVSALNPTDFALKTQEEAPGRSDLLPYFTQSQIKNETIC